MSDYWIRDLEGRVLGPVSFPVLKDLCSARRLMGVTHVSRDGRSWQTLQELPELAALLIPRPEPLLQADQQAEAARLRSQVHAAASAPAHLIFKVAEDAPLATFRAAYFALARRFHPTRLEANTHPELVAASREAFSFFAKRIAEVEQRLTPVAPPVGGPTRATPPPPPAEALMGQPVPAIPVIPSVPTLPRATTGAFTPPPPPAFRPAMGAFTPPPPPAGPVTGAFTPVPPGSRGSHSPFTPIPSAGVPEYRAEDFVGIERRNAERMHANIRVTPASYRMFTDHALVNISNGGLFINTRDLIPVGSLLDLELTFEGDSRTITARGRVVWESAGTDGKNARGMGLKLTQVSAPDLAFIKDFVRKAAMSGPSRS